MRPECTRPLVRRSGSCASLLVVAALSGSAAAGRLSGQIYESATGQPARGARLQLYYDQEDDGAPGELVPASSLGNGQQGQVTDRDGSYEFELPRGRVYRLVVNTDRTSAVFPSAHTPAEEGFAPPGPVVPDAGPGDPVQRRYFLRFRMERDADSVTNNHVPVDALVDSVELDVRADRPMAARGDLIAFEVNAANRSSRDLTTDAGRAANVILKVPRGLSVVQASLVAEVVVAGQRRRLGRDLFGAEEPRSGRLMRLGPVDLPAGAALIVRYHAVVGLDTRPGRYATRVSLTDAGGVDMAASAAVTVAVAADRALDVGVVMGRVFCDQDGDGRVDGGERGVMGARVYLDTGSYAVTDSAGMFHLSRVRPGTHLIKLDGGSLAGGRVLGSPRRLLTNTAGLPEIAYFPVDCVAKRVTFAHRWASGDRVSTAVARSRRSPAAAELVQAVGDVEKPRLVVAGDEIELPIAELRFDPEPALVDGPRTQGTGPDLVPVPDGGYRFVRPSFGLGATLPGGHVPERWQFTISAIDSAASAMPVFDRTGPGAPPPLLTWDGISSDGKPAASGRAYRAQLSVIGAAGSLEAASAVAVFGIGLTSSSHRRSVWPAAGLFTGPAERPVPAAALKPLIAALAASVRGDDEVAVTVHWDGTGESLEALARTQREAEIIAAALAAARVDTDRISARGRGSLEPVTLALDPDARRRNRRVVVTIKSTKPTSPVVVAAASGQPDVRINGVRQPVDSRGRFAVAVPVPKRGAMVVDMLAADGRRSAVDISLSGKGVAVPLDRTGPAGRSLTPRRGPRTVRISGDLVGGGVRVGTRELPEALFAVRVALAGVSSLAVDEVETAQGSDGRRLDSPLDFSLQVPDSLTVQSWTLAVVDSSEQTVYSTADSGRPPPLVRWGGRGESGELALLRDQRYRYSLSVLLADGTEVISAPRWFIVDPSPRNRAVDLSGRLFSTTGKPRAAVRNRLSRVVARMSRESVERSYELAVTVAGDGQRAQQVRDQLATYMSSLGAPAARYRVDARPSTDRPGRDRLIIQPLVVAPSQAGVEVDGKSVPVEGASFAVDVELAPGQSTAVEIRATGGQRIRVGETNQATTAPTGGSEAAPVDTGGEQRTTGQPAARKPGRRPPELAVWLPPQGTTLAIDELAITGSTTPGAAVTVNGEQATVDRDGRFAAIVPLVVGASELDIRSRIGGGPEAAIRWPVEVANRHVFAMGLGELILSTSYDSWGWQGDGAYLNGMNERSTLAVGPGLVHGRGVVYSTARVQIPDNPLGTTLRLTAHLDSAREPGTSAFFEQLVDPQRDAPIYGDSATEERDVNTRAPVYVRAELGESSAAFGSVHTGLAGGDFLRYDRTIDGAAVRLVGDIGAHHPEVHAFAAREMGEQVGDINWFRATGGSLYYLRNAFVLEGSERVRIVVRDRDSGLIVNERLLERNRDYTIDYEGGRVLLSEPLPSQVKSSWVLDSLETRLAPMSGHPVYLQVRYEHSDPRREGERTAGAYARDTIGGRLAVGAGLIAESRPDSDHSLWSADSSYRLGKTSELKAELAMSRDLGSDTMISIDGGLSFTDLHRVAATSGDGNAGDQYAWKLSADVDFAEVTANRALSRASVRLYAQDVDRGFVAESAVLDQGRFSFGAIGSYRLSSIDTLSLRHEGRVVRAPLIGPTAAELTLDSSGVLEEQATYLTSLQWARKRGRWLHALEAAHQRISSTAPLLDGGAAVDTRRLGIGGFSSYALNRAVTLRIGQQVVAATRDDDPVLMPIHTDDSTTRDMRWRSGLTTNVGSDLHMTEDVSFSTDYYQRWNGDNAAQLGFNSRLSDTGTVYIRERVGGVDGDLANTVAIGAEDQLGPSPGGRSYGEYQIESGVHGHRNRAVLGMGKRWMVRRGLHLGFGYEHQQLLGGFLPNGTPVGAQQRNVIHAGVDVTGYDRLKIAARVELRLDDGPTPPRADEDLLAEDPRAEAGEGGYPDHGGPIAGAPDYLLAGDRIQALASVGSSWKLARDHSWLTRLRLSQTTRIPPAEEGIRSYPEARFAEATGGWAFRPHDRDWLNILARYSYLLDQRPRQLDAMVADQRSHVVAVVPVVQLPWQLRLSGKVALKHTRSSLASISELGQVPASDSDALLILVRLGYRFLERWDITAEQRFLALAKPVGSERLLGNLFEVGHAVGEHLRLALGYNLSRFSDNEFGDLERDAHGFFVRVTGQY